MKNVFLKSTIILIIGGIITKILSFFVRIVYTRLIGVEGVSLYSLTLPTYSLLITIAQLSLPTTISKLVAENKNNNLKIVSNATYIILFINTIVMIIMLLSSKYIAINLLHEEKTYILLISMSLTFPIISISSIIKGYFYGKQNVIPNVVSNIVEEIVRITLIIIIIPILLKKSVELAAASLFIITFIEEVISIIVNLLFLPKYIKINKNHLTLDKYTTRDILSISIPSVSSRIIGNIGYFFEPIILKNILLYMGYSNNYILYEYGAYNAYTIPILTVPSFFIMAISQALVPEISSHFIKKDKLLITKRLKEAIIFSLFIGITYSIILIFYGDSLLNILYNTNKGLSYMKILVPIFPLFYIEAIFISFLQAINKANITFKITFIGIIIKLITLTLLSFLKIGIYSLIISEIINILIVVYLNIYFVKYYIKLL